jgi:hypothetical protein
VVAVVLEQTHPAERQDHELLGLQRRPQAPWLPDDPLTCNAVRSKVTRGRFDPETVRVPQPTGKRGRQPHSGDVAIQTCLTSPGEGRGKQCSGPISTRNRHSPGVFDRALREITGLVESFVRLVRLDWTVPDFAAPSRRQKTLAVTIPCRGSKGFLHLQASARAVLCNTRSASGSVPASRPGAKAKGTPASMVMRNADRGT